MSDLAALERECTIEFFVAGGPGGQHRNKVATGVRLRHGPSGLVVAATERRSQSANRQVALERLAARLAAAEATREPRIATRPSRASQRQRIERKRRQSAIKQQRRTVHEE